MNANNNNRILLPYKLGQLTGIIAGAVASILWMMTLWVPEASFSFNIASMAVVLLMIVLAIIVIVASLKGHSTVLIVIFGISFFPIGLYVLGIPHWIQWVGLANIGYLLAGVIIWRFKPHTTEDRVSPDPVE
ncbi:MAG: hypothetical protein ACI9XC_001203 [Gammaproteobacteria bacterium]|jgi:hypothetical protein